MSMVKPAVYDNGQIRYIAPGDVMGTNEVIFALANSGVALALTGAQVASGILRRTLPAGNYADIFPSATDLIAAIQNQSYIGGGSYTPVGVQDGTSFRLRYINTVAFTNTPTIGTGGTLGNNTAIAASSVKDYLITITSGTPPSVVSGNTTNASAVITGMNALQLQYVTAGQLITGTNIPAAATVLSVQPGVGVTISANATGTASGTALTFGPSYRVDGIGQMLL